jgi:hypothetical protein
MLGIPKTWHNRDFLESAVNDDWATQSLGMLNSPAWNGTQFGSMERTAKRFVVQRTVTT